MGNSFKTFSPRHYAPRGVNSSPHFHNGGLGQDLQLWGGRGQLLERPGYDLQAEVSSPKFTLRFLPTVMAVNTSCGPAVCQALGRTEHTSSQLNLHGGPWGSHSHPILQMGDWTSVTASNLSKGTQPGWGWGGAGAPPSPSSQMENVRREVCRVRGHLIPASDTFSWICLWSIKMLTLDLKLGVKSGLTTQI